MNKNWEIINNKLIKEFAFKDFKESLAFINRVGAESERLNHHPTIINTYNKVTIELWTHSEDSITDLDYKLSKSIDKVYE